eukprot:TRINITY_DN2337_c1_g2_i1.p1 TRINITY_DN2337_c1_g2~~TRINITY_DN2337_c1_g2_i1.p1  ORF type:complete len:1021 (+),score=395.39 TRINITY_DN2337_c1_g2_i1:107-3169(+)
MLPLLPSVCVGMVVKLLLPEEQPMIPFNKYGGPCSNVTKAGCTGGFPAMHAVLRDETAARDADHAITLGFFMQMEQLVDEHPLGFSVNDAFWGRAINTPAIRMGAPYVFSTSEYLPSAAYMQQATLPIVSTNLDESVTPMRGSFAHYYIARVAGLQIAYLNVFGDGYWAKTVPIEPYVKKLTAVLRAQGADTVVVQFMGSREGLSQLAQVDQDVVLAAVGTEMETHRLNGAWLKTYPYNGANRVLGLSLEYTQAPGGTGKLQLSNVTLKMRESTENGVSTFGDSTFAADAAFVQRLSDEAKALDPVIGYSTGALADGKPLCRYTECALGTFASEALQAFRGSDIALVNGGGLRKGWDEGNVTRSELSKAMPYKNTVCFLNTTAAGLWRALEHAVAAVGADGGYNATASTTGRFLQAAGLRYQFNPAKAPATRITAMEVYRAKEKVWAPIDPKRVYSVVTLGYLCNGGDGFAFEPANGTRMERTEVGWWGVLRQSLTDRSPYTPQLVGAAVANFTGAPLLLAKDAARCTEYERFDAQYEVCDACPEGFWHPTPGVHACTPIPPAAEEMDLVPIVAPAVVGFILLVAVLAVVVVRGRNNRLAEMTKFAPRGGGNVALIFTDIKKSSDLWGQFPEEMKEALGTHHTIARRCLEKHHGYEVKTIGDAFMCAFACPVRAVEFMMDLQLEFLAAEWPARLSEHSACAVEDDEDGRRVFQGLRVRAGCHVGEVNVKQTPQGGFDYEGADVNIAARVSDSGGGGQLLITQALYEMIQGELDDMCVVPDVTCLGEYRYKGIHEPQMVYSIQAEALAKRKYEPLRGCTEVDEEKIAGEVSGGSFRRGDSAAQVLSNGQSTVMVGSAKQAVLATNKIRKWARKYGSNGVPPNELALMFQSGCDGLHMTETTLITLILTYMLLQEGRTEAKKKRSAPPGNDGVSTANSPQGSQVVAYAIEEPAAAAGLRWGVISAILLKFPQQALFMIADAVTSQEDGLLPQPRMVSGTSFRSFTLRSPANGALTLGVPQVV